MPRARGPGTREKMLEVAERQFAQKGYEGAHLESIAREVGVRKTALYYYFESKAALYAAVIERMLGAFERRMLEVMRLDVDHVEKAKQIADQLHDVLAENPNYSQILIRIYIDRIPIDETRAAPIFRRVVEGALVFFREGVEAGVFRKMSSRHVFQSAMGMIVFHYAGGDISAAILGVEDIFEPNAVEWRRQQFREMLLHGVLCEGAEG